MEAAILFLLFALNGLFAMAEISLLSAKRSRAQALARSGNRRAQTLIRLMDNPTSYLSTVQIGITSIGLLSGIVGESLFADPLAAEFKRLGIQADLAESSATIIVIIAITYFAIVVGELVPKRAAQIFADPIALAIAIPMSLLAKLSSPFVWLLATSTNLALKVFGKRAQEVASISEADLDAVLVESSEAGVIEETERQLVQNLLRLDDMRLGSLMTPASEIIALEVSAEHEKLVGILSHTPHSRFPVCDGGLENILGVVSAKRALGVLASGQPLNLRDLLEPTIYLPESLTGIDAIEAFKGHNNALALVVDEYGAVEGLISLQDILNAVTGEFTPSRESDIGYQKLEAGDWLLSGALPVTILRDVLELETLPEEESGSYHTLGGMLLLLHGRIPESGAVTQWESWELEITQMEQKRIVEVVARQPAGR